MSIQHRFGRIRFREKMQDARADCFANTSIGRQTTGANYLYVRIYRFHGDNRCLAIHHGHVHVRKYDGYLLAILSIKRDRFCPIGCEQYPIAKSLQCVLSDDPQTLFIIHEQYRFSTSTEQLRILGTNLFDRY